MHIQKFRMIPNLEFVASASDTGSAKNIYDALSEPIEQEADTNEGAVNPPTPSTMRPIEPKPTACSLVPPSPNTNSAIIFDL